MTAPSPKHRPGGRRRGSRRRRALSAAAVATFCGLAGGCERGADDAGDEPRQLRPVPPAELRSTLTEPARLRGSYFFEGRRRRVDAEIAFDNLTDPYRGSFLAPVPGTRMVAVYMKVLNRGPDRFPLEWALLRGYDERGKPLPLVVRLASSVGLTPGGVVSPGANTAGDGETDPTDRVER